MTNKLVFLTLVVVLTPLASGATVSIVLDGGGTDVVAGSTVTIDVVADWDVSLNAGFNLMESTTSAAGDATALAAGSLNPGFDLINSPGALVNELAGTRFILIDRINGVINDGSPAIAAGNPLYLFDLLIPAGAAVGDTFTIDDVFGEPVYTPGPLYGTGIYGGGDVTDMEPLTLTVVPEPATVVLLGIGTLLLRRRK